MPPAAPHEAAKERRIELAVFLSLIVPPMIVAHFAGAQQAAFVLFAASTLLTDMAFVALVLFFLWRNGEPFVRAGLAWRHLGHELLVGALLYPAVAAGMLLVAALCHRLGLSEARHATPRFLAAQGGVQLMLASVLVLVVAFAEEVLFRGYLLLRLSEVQGRISMAVVLSAAVFSIGHTYEGAAGVVTVFAMGVALGMIRLWRGSLIAPIVIHALQDFLAIVVVPMLHR